MKQFKDIDATFNTTYVPAKTDEPMSNSLTLHRNTSVKTLDELTQNNIQHENADKTKEQIISNVVDDYQIVRNSIQESIKQALEAMQNALSIANDTESVRGFEVAAGMMETVAKLGKELINANKEVMKIVDDNTKPKDDGTGQKLTQTNVSNTTYFVGTTKDLQKALDSVTEVKYKDGE
jgi:DNA-binding ferritin-like protein